MSVEAFQYAPDKRAAVTEFFRVLRPGRRLAFIAFEVDPAKVAGVPVLGADPSRTTGRSWRQPASRSRRTRKHPAGGSASRGLRRHRRASDTLAAEMGEHAAASAVAEAMLTIEIQPYPRRVLAVASLPGRARRRKRPQMNQIADAETLRRGVRESYRTLHSTRTAICGSYTGRPLAAKLGYPSAVVDAMPAARGVLCRGQQPLLAARARTAGTVVDVGSGAGFDAFVAAGQVGDDGRVVGVDMTPEMIRKSRDTASALGLDHVEFREGLAENLPIEDGWADVVISNGVINLCADKQAVFAEIHRVLRLAERCSSPTSPPGAPYRPKLATTSTSEPSASRRALPRGLAGDARRLQLRQRGHRTAS